MLVIPARRTRPSTRLHNHFSCRHWIDAAKTLSSTKSFSRQLKEVFPSWITITKERHRHQWAGGKSAAHVPFAHFHWVAIILWPWVSTHYIHAGCNTVLAVYMVRAQWHASVSARTYDREYVCGASIIGAHFAHLPVRGVHRSVKFIRLVLIKQSAVLMKSTHRHSAAAAALGAGAKQPSAAVRAEQRERTAGA